MSKLNGFYKCEICGNLVSVLEAGGGTLVCCGQDMKLLEEKKVDEGKEKHVPVLEIKGDKVLVKVGSVEHPMEDKHYIELIQIVKGEKVLFEKRLFSGEKPEAEFCLKNITGIKAREICNVHGLWGSE